MYTTLSGLVATERSLESVAQNIANASTPGYRARVTTFQEALTQFTDTPSVRSAGVAVDLSRGVLTKTDNPLDVALNEEGFFVVETSNGRQLTRDGSFRLDAHGTLVNRDGNPVIGAGGNRIEVPPDAPAVRIGTHGVVSAAGARLGRVLVVRVAPENLVPAGSRFALTENAEVDEVAAPRIEPGALESSNFDPIRGMVELIRVTRAHEALARSLQSHSEIEHRTARGITGN